MTTVFTPTYNRANLLPRLFSSLCAQDCNDFEWLVVNDGSTDTTEDLFDEWMRNSLPFAIRYFKVSNGGKMCAINEALELANGDFFFIVDSDDALAPNAISFIENAFRTLPKDDDSFIGISGLRVQFDGGYIHGRPLIDTSVGYVDCSNLERSKYNLQSDMAEAYYTSKIRKYKFSVWGGEKFTPEAVVWDKMALDGYQLRWFDAHVYYCEYQENGLSDSTWSLLKNNPMGYAMLFNNQLVVNEYRKQKGDTLTQGISWIINTVIQFISCCCLAREFSYIKNCESCHVWLLLFPGFLVGMRRRWQFSHCIK